MRNAFNRFMYRLSVFMNQRYGIDRLFYVLMVLFLILAEISILFSLPWLRALQLLLLVYIMFRVLSKNTARRRHENEVFMSAWNKVKGFFRLNRDRIRYRREFVFRRCPHCSAQLRLPRKSGEHTVRCSRCSGRFDVKIK